MTNNDNENVKNLNPNATKHRSPGFPVIPLEEAISKLQIIYNKDKLAFINVDAMILHLGYKGGRGGSAGRVIAALKHYGLLDEKSGQFRVSDVGYRILHLPEDSQEKATLIKEAALSPSTFQRVLNYYNGELPSDTTLRSYLILNEKFNPDSVDKFISVFRETVALANSLVTSENKLPQENTEVTSKDAEETLPSQNTHLSNSNNQPIPSDSLTPFLSGESLKFRLSRDSDVVVSFSGKVTQESIEKLNLLLDATKDTYPTKAELEQLPVDEDD